MTDHVFEQIADFLFTRKRHFTIDLREFRLAIRSQIFVTKTFRNLVITIETCDHQQLFEQLRRLRQCEKFSRIDAGRHKVIACAFRCRFGQHRRFDIDETVFIQILADLHGDLVAQTQIILHLRATQIEYPVSQASRFGKMFVIELERRRDRRISSTSSFSQNTSTFPDARLSLAVPAGRSRTVPVT